MLTTGAYRQSIVLLALLVLAAPGCSRLKNVVPPQAVTPTFFDAPRASKEPINFTRLRQEPPQAYLLGPRDILGIYIEGVLGRAEDAPPVHFSEKTDIPPAIGFPIPIREDGTLSLPLIPPIPVTGLTVAQAEYEIRKAYTIDNRILQPDRQRIVVTLMKPRTYNIMVVREDTTISSYGWAPATRTEGFEPQRRAFTRVVELNAYENDVLHALAESGGLPGVDAKSEVKILRSGMKNPDVQQKLQQGIEDPATRSQLLGDNANVVRIPLRVSPNEAPMNISPDDIILQNGDILFIESRDSEVFYTGGQIRGGQFPIPRDYDLDVLGAIAMAGGSIASGAGGTANQAYRGGIGSIFPPSRITVVRTVRGQMVPIQMNLKTALTNPAERILIQPNDLILLEYTDFEMFMNIVLNNLTLNLSVNDLIHR